MPDRSHPASAPDAARASRRFSWALLACAGWTDAVGFLMFSGLFVSFMSGDTTQLGINFAHGDWEQVGKFAAPPAVFVLGAALGRLVAVRAGDARTALLLLVGLLLAIAAAGGAAGMRTAPLIAALVAMGMLNSVMREADGVPVGTMITGALVRLGESLADLVLKRPAKVRDNAGQWLAFLIAVVLGTLAYRSAGPSALLVPAAACALLAFAAARMPGPRQRSTHTTPHFSPAKEPQDGNA